MFACMRVCCVGGGGGGGGVCVCVCACAFVCVYIYIRLKCLLIKRGKAFCDVYVLAVVKNKYFHWENLAFKCVNQTRTPSPQEP